MGKIFLIAGALFFILTVAKADAQTIINDGDLIKTATHENVYIVKIVGGKKFKRLILNPDIFNQYSHLKWENIKVVSESIFGQYQLSYLVREIIGTQIFKLFPDEDTGTKRWLNTSWQEFESAGLDWDSVYIINQHERVSYNTGQDLLFNELAQRYFEYGIIPGISSTNEINKVEDLGVDIVRLVPKDLSFAKEDLQDRGIEIMVQKVDEKPDNLSGVPPPSDYAKWVQDLKNLVSQHKDVKYWQVWNEPNVPLFWYPQPNAPAYVNLLKMAYVAIKEANPQAIVVGGGPTGINPPKQYLRDMYAAGARNYFDVLALNPYGQPNSPDVYLRNYLLFMKNIMEAYGDLDTPIWITEIGWPTAPDAFGTVSETQQAEYLRRAYEIAQSLDFVEKVFWYRLQDVEGDGMGILGKPAEGAYRSITP